MDLISVIVPVYKVEPYLDKCIASIVNQTYRNLEIILVDDGSPDRCGQICDEWAEKDSRIRVIHKTNGGLSDARNAGMAVASGEWIAFVDSDDWIGAQLYETLLNAARHNNAQISTCQVQRFRGNCIPHPSASSSIQIFSASEAMLELILDRNVQQITTNKLFCANLVNKISFEKGKCHEDEYWTYQVIAKCSTLVVTNYVGYYYLQRDDSIMGQSFSIKRLDAIEAKCLRHRLVTKQLSTLSNESLKSIWRICIYQGQSFLNSRHNRADMAHIFQILTSTLEHHPLPRKRPKEISPKEWLWFNFSKLSLKAVCMMRNLLKIGV